MSADYIVFKTMKAPDAPEHSYCDITEDILNQDLARYRKGIPLMSDDDLVFELDSWGRYYEAISIGKSLIERHRYIAAFWLAGHFYDYQSETANDVAWPKYMLIGIEHCTRPYNYQVYFNTQPANNDCGIWYPGHHPDRIFYRALEEYLYIVTNCANISRAYCKKKGDHYAYHESAVLGSTPITTTFDKTIEDEVYGQLLG